MIDAIHGRLRIILDCRKENKACDFYYQGCYHIPLNSFANKKIIEADSLAFFNKLPDGFSFEVTPTKYNLAISENDYCICVSDLFMDELIKAMKKTHILNCFQTMPGVMEDAAAFKNILIERHSDTLNGIVTTIRADKSVEFSVSKSGVMSRANYDGFCGSFWGYNEHGMANFSEESQAVGMGLAIAEKMKEYLPDHYCYFSESSLRIGTGDFHYISFYPIEYQRDKKIEQYQSW